MTDPLLQVENLKTHLPLEEGLLKAVDGISFSIRRGQTMGLVGESGCGKSMAVNTIMRLAPNFAQIEGDVTYFPAESAPVNITALDPYGPEIRDIRGGEIAMIFQEPMTSFSPLHTIGNQITEAIRLHRTEDQKEATRIAIDLLQRVGMSNPAQRMNEYPHQLSGGMRQRVAFARSLAFGPGLLLMDEPLSALDEMTREEMRYELLQLWERQRPTVIFVTHSIPEAVVLSDRVVVLSSRPGEIVNDITINLPRPRQQEVERSDLFLEYTYRVKDALSSGILQ